MNKSEQRHTNFALLSILLENRKLGWAMLGGGMIYFAVSLAGLSLPICPVKQISGYDCPGCGLTRGSKAMLSGDWQCALAHHWFTPVFMVFWSAVGLGLILPEPWRGKFLQLVRKSEQLTWWPLWLGVGLIIYALTRNISG